MRSFLLRCGEVLYLIYFPVLIVVVVVIVDSANGEFRDFFGGGVVFAVW